MFKLNLFETETEAYENSNFDDTSIVTVISACDTHKCLSLLCRKDSMFQTFSQMQVYTCELFHIVSKFLSSIMKGACFLAQLSARGSGT